MNADEQKRQEARGKSKGAQHTMPMKLPAPYENVRVRCATFRCLAYVDEEGKWHEAFTRRELSEVLEVES